MKLIKHCVSGKNRRFIDTEHDLDLDLTYITPRIIAMGYPSTAFIEQQYRNSGSEVASLLEREHSNHYTVFNLTDRVYNSNLFPTAQVFNFPFPDHHAPPFSLLIQVLDRMHQIYHNDPDSVLVIHCLAGHGRTGTVISSFLLYEEINDITTPEGALRFFAQKRSYKEKGVSHPSQKRFVYYAYLYKQSMIQQNKSIFSLVPPISRRIKKITFHHLFFDNNPKNLQSIYFVLLDSSFEVIFNSAWIQDISGKLYTKPEVERLQPPNVSQISFNVNMVVQDDITLKLYKIQKLLKLDLQKKEWFRISINTIFCSEYGAVFPKFDIDGPHKDVTNKEFPAQMSVSIEMEPPANRSLIPVPELPLRNETIKSTES